MTRFIIAGLGGLLASVNAHAAPFPQPNFAPCDFTVPTTFKNIWYIDPVKEHTMSAYTAAGVSLNPTVSPHQGDINHPWKDFNPVSTTIANARALGYTNPLMSAGIGPIL